MLGIPFFIVVDEHHGIVVLGHGQVKQFISGHGQDAFVGQENCIYFQVVFEAQFDAFTQAVDIVAINLLVQGRGGNEYFFHVTDPD